MTAEAEGREGTAPLTLTQRPAYKKSDTPTVYVPRRFRIGGIEGIPTGAAIVGTPQGDGMIAIDVVSTPYVEPSAESWANWVAEAFEHHEHRTEEERHPGERPETKLVSEAALVEVGQCIQGHVRIDEPEEGARLSRWLQAGKADYVVERPFPHE